MTALISVARRAELAAALARGDVPFKGDDGVVYVGNPKIRLTNKLGHLLQAGYAWIQMGGVNPMRNGEPILDGGKNYVMRLHWSSGRLVWLPIEDGLRLRNC